MIQFKRGKTDSWSKQKKPLADGQPGYDRDRHKIKIGDGKSSWDELPYVGGLSEEEVLSPEKDAKERRKKAKLLFPFNELLAKLISPAIITYGEEAPDKDTIGQLYLQQYETAPEADYITAYGVDGIWTYQIWNSGFARCRGIISCTTYLKSSLGGSDLFTGDVVSSVNYPFKFKKITTAPPAEAASLIAATGHVAWLASISPNSLETSGTYTIISYTKQDIADYSVVLDVAGFIDKDAWTNKK